MLDSVAAFAEEMSDIVKTSELTQTRAFVHSFVKEVEVKPGRAAIVYTICQGRRDIRPCGGVKVYHRDVGAQHECHHAAGVRRIR